MKTIIFLLPLYVCSAFGIPLRIEFKDTEGHKYQIQTFADDYSKRTGVKIEAPRFAIVESLSADSTFKKQMIILDTLGEEYKLIIVEACTKACNDSGYSVTSPGKLNIKGFKITLLDENGHILKTSKSILNTKEIQKTFRASDARRSGSFEVRRGYRYVATKTGSRQRSQMIPFHESHS